MKRKEQPDGDALEPYELHPPVLGEQGVFFGLWPDGDPSTGTLEEARDGMLAQLRRHLPKPPATILILGASPGFMAHRLSREGFVVEAASPFESAAERLGETYRDSGVDLHPADFTDVNGFPFNNRTFDAVLFLEALRYFSSPDEALRTAASLLKPDGRLVIEDEVRLHKPPAPRAVPWLRADIVTGIYENGMFISRTRETGGDAPRTCEHVLHRIPGRVEGAAGGEDETRKWREVMDALRARKQRLESGETGCEIFIVKKSLITVRSYAEGDEHAILPAFMRIFSTTRSLEHWRWKFEDNPFGTRKIALAFHDNGDLAAQYATFPVPFYSSAPLSRGPSAPTPSDFIALQVGDIMTEPAYRKVGRGPTSVLAGTTFYFYNKFCIHRKPFTYGFLTGPHKKFGELFLRYEYAAEIPYHVLDAQKLSSRLTFWEKTARLGYSVEKVTDVGGEFDRFFEKVRDDYGLLIRRNAAWLKWRYLDCPDNVHHIFAIRRFGRLAGWSVFSAREDALVWGDALFDKKSKVAPCFMIEHVANRFFPNASRVIAWCSPAPAWWTDRMRAIGFEVEPEPNRLTPAYAIFHPGFTLEMLDRRRYYTMGDSDLF